MTAVLVVGVAAWFPVSPFAHALGLVALPALYWPILFVTLLGYVILTQFVKKWLLRMGNL